MQFVRQCPGLTKADLVEMKSYAAPPKDIQRCMMGLCMLTSNPAAAKITTDAEAKKKLGTASFLKQIINLKTGTLSGLQTVNRSFLQVTERKHGKYMLSIQRAKILEN